MRTAILLLFCLALSGCTIALYGHQSTSDGVTTTTTSSHVTGSGKVSGAKVSFSSGQPVSPKAPGGHVSLGKGASAALVLGLVIADVVNYFRGAPRPAHPSGGSIADTCSCYQKPVTSDQ